jgi:hypothetical protein
MPPAHDGLGQEAEGWQQDAEPAAKQEHPPGQGGRVGAAGEAGEQDQTRGDPGRPRQQVMPRSTVPGEPPTGDH